jgi:hypothetical protein
VVHYERSFLVRFYAVDGEHRARVTDVATSRSWTVAGDEAAGRLQAQLVRDDRDHLASTHERPS